MSFVIKGVFVFGESKTNTGVNLGIEAELGDANNLKNNAPNDLGAFYFVGDTDYFFAVVSSSAADLALDLTDSIPFLMLVLDEYIWLWPMISLLAARSTK